MTKKETISLSLKLAGIYCLIMSLSHLNFASMNVATLLRRESLWHMLSSSTSFVLLLLSITPFALLLLFAVYLMFSSRLPSKMASLIIQEDQATSCTFRDIQMLAFSIVGIWLLASAISNLIQPIVRIIVLHSTSQESSVSLDTFNISQLVIGISKLAFGIYLFLGGKGLVRLWQKFQSTESMKSSD
jgi:Ca2+/Na+ antiporter